MVMPSAGRILNKLGHHRIARKRGKRDRGHKVVGGSGEHHLHLRTGFYKEPNQENRLIGGDAAADAY